MQKLINVKSVKRIKKNYEKYIYTSILFCFALYAMIQATDNNSSKVVIKKKPSILGTSVNTKDDDFAAGTEIPHDQKEIKNMIHY